MSSGSQHTVSTINEEADKLIVPLSVTMTASLYTPADMPAAEMYILSLGSISKYVVSLRESVTIAFSPTSGSMTLTCKMVVEEFVLVVMASLL